jgi:hypothetical protein
MTQWNLDSARSTMIHYRLIDCELDSNLVQVAMSLQGHTLREKSESDVFRLK